MTRAATIPMAKKQPAVRPLSKLAQRAHAAANADFWKPEPGDSVEGIVIQIGQGGKYNSLHFYIRQDGGETITVSASPNSVLGGKIEGEHIAVGDRLYVEFIGKKTSKRGEVYHDWAVASEKSASNGAGGQPPLDDDVPPF